MIAPQPEKLAPARPQAFSVPKARGQRNDREAPISIYEVHLGSWRRTPATSSKRTLYSEQVP